MGAKSHLGISLVVMLVLLSGCSTQKFKAPDIKDDFCGAHINYQYCKCAFHKEFCDSIGMSRSEAKSYVNSEYNAWVAEKLYEYQALCAASGGIPDGEVCIQCMDAEGAAKKKCEELEKSLFGVIEKDGVLNLNSKPGQVLEIKSEDLPAWARGEIATLGSVIAVVGSVDTVTEGDPFVLLDGKPIARLGDGTAQGGSIVEGSEKIFVNGQPVAIIGSMTVNPTVGPGSVPRVGGPIASTGNQ